MKKVLIIKRYDRKFRVPLYDILGTRLKHHDIELKIIFGQPDRLEIQTIKDLIENSGWGEKIVNRYFYFGKRSICWQPVLRQIRSADLIIVQQGNRELINYLLQIYRLFRKKPLLAFWGHGMNFQSENPASLPEKFKAFYSNFVDYWFAYNDLSRDVMIHRGFNPQKIFSLQNTIDSKTEVSIYNSITDQEMNSLRLKHDISPEQVVGIYCGSLYPQKRIDFLIQALLLLKNRIKNFHFIIIGDGILRPEVIDLIKGNENWIHYVGAQYGREKLAYFKLASFQLIPGLVGLNIIDSFITLTPLITTENKLHSPEISYLINNENGIITPDNLEHYTNAIVKLSNDNALQRKLVNGCKSARDIYTIDNMANNFFQGIMKILN